MGGTTAISEAFLSNAARRLAAGPDCVRGMYAIDNFSTAVAGPSIAIAGRRSAASWNDGSSKVAIVEFVRAITTAGSPDFVAAPERIAVFDNDGTLWSEQPLYFQLLFVIDRIRAMAPEHPEWKSKEPFRSVLAGDMKGLHTSGEKGVFELLTVTHTGMTIDEFASTVREWMATARHPTSKKPYNEMTFQPMIDVLTYLRANGFKTFIVSGGGAEFMRPWVESAYGIPPEQVVGSRGKLTYEVRNGQPMLVKSPAIDLVDDGPGKPVGIAQMIGRRPIAAFGNPTAIFRCSNTPLPALAGDSDSSCTTPMRIASGLRPWIARGKTRARARRSRQARLGRH
jgi:phosphoglycolate phosphatase-like HAD superfamily hydrolase